MNLSSVDRGRGNPIRLLHKILTTAQSYPQKSEDMIGVPVRDVILFSLVKTHSTGLIYHNIHQSNELFERSLSWNHFNVWRTPESDCRCGHTRRLKFARLHQSYSETEKTQNCFLPILTAVSDKTLGVSEKKTKIISRYISNARPTKTVYWFRKYIFIARKRENLLFFLLKPLPYSGEKFVVFMRLSLAPTGDPEQNISWFSWIAPIMK